jgi:hypothetical protein
VTEETRFETRASNTSYSALSILGSATMSSTTHPYLSERGLTPATIETFGLGYSEKGIMKNRIAIPINNREGKLDYRQEQYQLIKLVRLNIRSEPRGDQRQAWRPHRRGCLKGFYVPLLPKPQISKVMTIRFPKGLDSLEDEFSQESITHTKGWRLFCFVLSTVVKLRRRNA